MMIYGVTPEGFRKKTYPEIMADLEKNLRLNISDDLYFEPETEIWQICKVFADAMADSWEVEEQNYYSKWPSTASGTALDNALEYTSDKRLDGTNCLITKALIECPAPLTVGQGTEFFYGPEKDIFITDQTVSLILVPGTEPDTPDIYQAFCSLSSQKKASFLMRENETLINKDLHPDLKITVKNFQNGSSQERDHELKARRIKNAGSGARSTTPGIESWLKAKVPGLVSAQVITPETDGPDGQPAGTVQVLTDGGRDDDIARELFNNCIASGTRLWGRQTETVTDQHGNHNLVSFSRVNHISIFVLAEIRLDQDFRPPGSDQQISHYLAALIVRQGNRLRQGNDVRSEPWLTGAFRDIPEIREAEIGLSTSSIPENTLRQNINIELWQRAVFSLENVKVVIPDSDSVSDKVSVVVRCSLNFLNIPQKKEGLLKDLSDRICDEINMTKRGAILSPRMIISAIDHQDFSHGTVIFSRKSEPLKSGHNLSMLATEKAFLDPSDLTIELTDIP